MSLFPMITPQTSGTGSDALPLYTEVAWNFEKGVPRFRNGRPVVTTGVEAIETWAWKALITVRYRHEIYSRDFGCELENLIGQAWTEDLKRAEAQRYVREALLINPYITAVENIQVEFDNGTLHIEAEMKTVYGKANLSVSV